MPSKNKTKRKRELKLAILEVCGGCKLCGYKLKESLTFHHINPSLKKYDIGELLHLSWENERLIKEINKCVILCLNCHNKIHCDEVQNKKELPNFKPQFYPKRSPILILKDYRNSKIKRLIRKFTFRKEFVF